jgi:hypothetical protein
VSSSSAAPAAPPAALSRPSRHSRDRCPTSSGRDPAAEPKPTKTSAVVLVTLDASGGSPEASSAGYETRLARPATTLTTPASTPVA